jgi:hypothetical protein
MLAGLINNAQLPVPDAAHSAGTPANPLNHNRDDSTCLPVTQRSPLLQYSRHMPFTVPERLIPDSTVPGAFPNPMAVRPQTARIEHVASSEAHGHGRRKLTTSAGSTASSASSKPDHSKEGRVREGAPAAAAMEFMYISTRVDSNTSKTVLS